MTSIIQRVSTPFFAVLLATGATPFALAQTAALYDPQPPADSAYVRVLVGNTAGAIEVAVDGKARIANLAAGEPSDYLVLGAGKHKLTVHAKGKPTMVDVNLDVVAGRATTVALPELLSDAKPVLFEDKANGNKLKAVLAVYNLNAKLGPIDILSADGSTRVFAKVAPGATASIAVNPLTIDLIATKPDDKAALGTVAMAMTQGASYSIVVTASDSGKPTVKSFANKVERYTGK
jgi:alginate O-acetyltransferase complex protein AlgF